MKNGANVRRIPLETAAVAMRDDTLSADPSAHSQTHRGGTDSPCRALVVDDDALVRTRLQQLLMAADFEVEVAASGEEALRLLSGLAAGADAYVTKGSTPDEVLACAEAGRRVTRRNHEFRLKARGLGESTYLDRTTEAYSVAYLLTHLPCELSRARLYGHALAILYCKINDFPGLVDRFGSESADAERREFVTRCRSALRRDDWIARIGLDDFVIILPETSNAGAHKAAPKLRNLFRLHELSTAAEPVGFTVTMTVTTVDPNYPAGSPAQVAALLHDAKRGVFIDVKASDRSSEPTGIPGTDRALH